jgi:hypothetical protein
VRTCFILFILLEESTNSFESIIEKETLLVNIGDVINLTCIINAKEVDWHFKGN